MSNKFFKKKSKHVKIITIFAMLSAVVFYACQEDFLDSPEGKYESLAIQQAKSWYEANKPEEAGLSTPDGTEKVLIDVNWTNVFATRNELYDIVETDIMSQGIVSFTNAGCMEK